MGAVFSFNYKCREVSHDPKGEVYVCVSRHIAFYPRNQSLVPEKVPFIHSLAFPKVSSDTCFIGRDFVLKSAHLLRVLVTPKYLTAVWDRPPPYFESPLYFTNNRYLGVFRRLDSPGTIQLVRQNKHVPNANYFVILGRCLLRWHVLGAQSLPA